MRAVHHTEDGISIADDPVGAPDDDSRDDWIPVRMAASGICGSDLHLMEWGPLAVTPGHEVAGRTPDGQAVAVEPNVHCDACEQCLAGNTQFCLNGTIIGIGVPGGMADEVLVPEQCLVPLADDAVLDDANLVEPLGVAVHGLHRAELTPGQRVAAIGAGTIGLCGVAAALAQGCEVDVEARHAHQEQAAEQLGAGIGLSGTYDFVIEGAGTTSALAHAVEVASAGGTISVLGSYWGDMTAPGLMLTGKELKVIPGFAYCCHDGTRDIDRAASLLVDRPEISDAIISHRFGLDDAAEAFRVAADRQSGAIKVVVQP